MFPSACPFLEHSLEAAEGLSRAAACREAECPWFKDECRFIGRFVKLMVGHGTDGTSGTSE